MKPIAVKTMVKEKYASIAKGSTGGCCSSGCCGSGTADYSVFSSDYSKLDGYVPEADLGLGCGIPTKYAGIKAGQTVVDLGSGAGNDCFVVRRIVGEAGKVIGLDMTEEMVNKAKENNKKMGYVNVDFRLGEIEDMPIESNIADVVVSNCVLNLVPDKGKAFSEIYRIIKPGGHFCVSDIVLVGEMPEKLKSVAELYAGCISGAISKHDYLDTIQSAGFESVKVESEKEYLLPDNILTEFMDKAALEDFRKSGVKILSITVVAKKG
jgi:ubiquinone/menaquinone biosynthesis C-methylase UbiE